MIAYGFGGNHKPTKRERKTKKKQRTKKKMGKRRRIMKAKEKNEEVMKRKR